MLSAELSADSTIPILFTYMILLDVQKITEYSQGSVCLMCKYAFCKDFTEPVSYTHLDVYKRQVLVPLRRINGEPCLTDQLLQCLAFLEANVLDVLNTIYCLLQRTSTCEDELYIRQLLTDLDEGTDTLLL